jgi:hypothetical protein
VETGLQRLREPAVVVVLVVLVLRLVLAVATLAFFGAAGANALIASIATAAFTVTDGLTLVVLVLLVGSCVLWSPTRHARSLTLAALVVAGLGVALALAGSVTFAVHVDAAGAAWPDAARLLLELAVPVLAVLALGRLLAAQPRSVPAEEQPSLTSGRGTDDPAPAEVEAAPDPANEPTWQPDQASGAAWLTAGDAATGAAASGWGTPGESAGWEPRPPGPAADRPTRAAERDPEEPPRS